MTRKRTSPDDDKPADIRDVPDVSEIPTLAMYSSEELRDMPLSQLVSHTVRLQQLYEQVDSDYRIQSWEFATYQEYLTFFSRALKLAHKLNAADLESLAQTTVFELPQYFTCNFGALYFYNEDAKQLELCRSSVPVPESAPLSIARDASHFLVRLMLEYDHPTVVDYVDAQAVRVGSKVLRLDSRIPEGWHRLLGEACIVFPLRLLREDKKMFLGGLVIGDSRRELEGKDAEVSMLFTDLVSSSLYMARLVEKLNEMTIIDPLTQIFNRRHLLAQLNSAMLNANRYGHPLSLAMLDIDYFKRFNDTYGHICGDMVLKEIGALLKRAVRTDVDLPFRYGGEEFVIVMPYVGLPQALLAAERLRCEVRTHVFPFAERRLSVTCSLGVAQYVVGESVEQFIDRADVAMYKAKNSGRDRVEAAE